MYRSFRCLPDYSLILVFIPVLVPDIVQVAADLLIRNFPVQGFQVFSHPPFEFLGADHFPFLQEAIEELSQKYNIFIIYGRNQRLKKYLQAQPLPSVRSFSFYEDIWELFQLASVVITKPGGLTSFEGMYLRKPFIFTHYIPGQEKENMELLIYLDIAKYVQVKEEFLEAIDFFVRNEQKISKEYPITVCDIRPALKNKISLITQNK